jgi:N-acetylglutamate synthase-like GNAT family acetyltransferase
VTKSGDGVALSLREVEIFRPYDDGSPEQLLRAQGATEAQIERWMSADMVRIAKLSSEVLGMYAMDKGEQLTYILRGVVIDPKWRHQGLGRWLVGHAIGVAESKGGRHVLFASDQARRFLGHVGFVDDDRGQRFDLIQE